VAPILDTGPLLAAADRTDARRADCRRLLDESDELLVVPAPVLPEFDSVMSSVGPTPMIELIRDIEDGAVVVEDLEVEDDLRVRHLMDRYVDLDVGFVDAAVLRSSSGSASRSSRRSTTATSR
jgi:hypothetical protein